MYTIQDMISLHGHRTTLFIIFLSTENPHTPQTNHQTDSFSCCLLAFPIKNSQTQIKIIPGVGVKKLNIMTNLSDYVIYNGIQAWVTNFKSSFGILFFPNKINRLQLKIRATVC